MLRRLRLRVDNCSITCITSSHSDVVDTPIPIVARIEGFTGGTAIVTARCTGLRQRPRGPRRNHHVDVSEIRGVVYVRRQECLEETASKIRLANSHNPPRDA